MKDTAGRAGLHVRSSKDYLLCLKVIKAPFLVFQGASINHSVLVGG